MKLEVTEKEAIQVLMAREIQLPRNKHRTIATVFIYLAICLLAFPYLLGGGSPAVAFIGLIAITAIYVVITARQGRRIRKLVENELAVVRDA